MSRVIVTEPHGITPDLSNYKSALSRAFNFYNQDKDKKDARLYLKTYIKHKGMTVDIIVYLIAILFSRMAGYHEWC